ncbi:hypothetical protein DW757_04925 [Clostridium sp. AM29-11AC]|nr:hypothetical protein DW757_04925 [Clostridium sp. AM29-11AC]
MNEGRIFLLYTKPVFSSISERGVYFIVVLIGLVIIFKEQINKLLETIFKEINSQSKEVYK